MSLPKPQALIEELCQSHSFTSSSEFDFGEVRISVRCNSNTIIEQLNAYYSEFQSSLNTSRDSEVAPSQTSVSISVLECEAIQPEKLGLELAPYERDEPGKTLKENFCDLDGGRAIQKSRTGMFFVIGRGSSHRDNLAVGPCEKNLAQVVNFVNNRVIQHYLEQRYLLGHASALSTPSGALAIAGFAGRGKSSLALHMMCDTELRFVSNDRIMFRGADDQSSKVSKTPVMGIAKHPRINPGTLLSILQLRSQISEENIRQWSRLAPEQLWQLEIKHDVIVDEVYGSNRFNLESDLKALILLNWTPGLDAEAQMNRIDASRTQELLPALMKSPGLFFLAPEGYRAPTPDDYMHHLKNVAVFEVTGGTNFRTIRDESLKLIRNLPEFSS